MAFLSIRGLTLAQFMWESLSPLGLMLPIDASIGDTGWHLLRSHKGGLKSLVWGKPVENRISL
jgi:hypothetical protein